MRVRASIEIKGKEYKIEEVSMYISELYSEMVNMSYAQSDIMDKLEEIDLEYQIASEELSGIELKKKKLEYIKRIRELKTEARDNIKKIADKRLECLRELLELNGYSFDEKLWTRTAGVEAVNDFILQAISGDDKKKEVTDLIS